MSDGAALAASIFERLMRGFEVPVALRLWDGDLYGALRLREIAGSPDARRSARATRRHGSDGACQSAGT